MTYFASKYKGNITKYLTIILNPYTQQMAVDGARSSGQCILKLGTSDQDRKYELSSGAQGFSCELSLTSYIQLLFQGVAA